MVSTFCTLVSGFQKIMLNKIIRWKLVHSENSDENLLQKVYFCFYIWYSNIWYDLNFYTSPKQINNLLLIQTKKHISSSLSNVQITC